ALDHQHLAGPGGHDAGNRTGCKSQGEMPVRQGTGRRPWCLMHGTQMSVERWPQSLQALHFVRELRRFERDAIEVLRIAGRGRYAVGLERPGIWQFLGFELTLTD